MKKAWIVVLALAVLVSISGWAVINIESSLRSQLHDLRKSYDELKSRYEELQSRYLALSKTYSELQRTLQENLSSLLENYSILKEKCEKLKREVKYEISVLVDRDYYSSLISDFKKANESILVAMYLMVYDPDDPLDWANDLIRELVNARERGVNVTVVIEYRTHTGYMDSNLEAYSYLSANGVNVKLDEESDTDHMKLVIIDDKIVYIGSHNWSESALYYNHETSVKIVSEEIAETFKEYFKGI